MSQFELVSQFTEDAYATEDRLCERPACQLKIAKGAPCFYVATIEPEKPGHHVCMNAAQRKSTINPPPVVAYSQAHLGQSMCPPPGTHSAGPDITVPSSWGQPQDIAHAHRSGPSGSGPSGYSENHANYGAQCECWAKLAYALPPMDTIMLEISAVHEGGAQKKGHGVPIGNIREGKKDILMFGVGFPWHIEEFIIRDAMWVDLSTHMALFPYFFSQCMIPSKKGSKGLTFKTKQFSLMVVIPEAQWNEYEEWVEKADEVPTRQRVLPTSISEASQSHQAVSCQPIIIPPTSQLSTSTKRTHTRCNLSTSTSSSSPPHKKPAQAVSPRALFTSTTSSSPPHKKPAQAVSPGALFRSPDREDLMQALRSGGTADLDVAQVLDTYTKHIQFYPIPTRLLADILKNVNYRSFALDSSQSIIGQLTVNASTRSMLGAGAFKMAHPGWLSLTPLMKSGLGSIAGQAIAVKRPFHKRGSKAPAKAGSKAGSSCTGFLVEELIKGGQDEFVKFIHNMDSNPLLDYDDYRYEVALFFAFTQHVQYIKTGGLAFISDYQGSTELLTDLQILTAPSVSKGEDLFGARNIECTVRMFEKQHKCNKFCRWSGFGLEPFVEQAEEAEVEADDEVEAEDEVEDTPLTA
ncbi:hypothetical protein BDR05DRAFT_1000732 [Suillus weaverae]|nr:hypothetical protein BDR05DRAFT_1000732 [Suillus weaverae]